MIYNSHKLQKLVVLVGPTASGKTSWSLKLAKDFNGEVICADSRQIFKKMNVGTAKVSGEWKWSRLRKTYFVENIAHHLIDFLDPGKVFTVAEFRDKAIKYTKLIHKNGKIPFMSGGTGLYVQSVIDNYEIPRVSPNSQLRSSLGSRDEVSLLQLLKQLDPKTAETIDKKNKRRIIRALEVSIFSGQPFSEQKIRRERLFDTLLIGIDVPRDVLYDRIHMRIDSMIESGLEREVSNLLKQKYDWQLPSMQGIGYRQFRKYFEGEKSLEETIELLKRDTRHYARRQMTWFRRDKRINWITDYSEVKRLVKNFLEK